MNDFIGIIKAYLKVKNFNLIEFFVIGCISISLLMFGAIGGMGDYIFFEQSFGDNEWVFRTYLILFFILIIILTIILCKFFHKGVNIYVFLFFTFFIYFLSVIFTVGHKNPIYSNKPYQFIGISNYYCLDTYGPINRTQGPIEEYEYGNYQQCHSISNDFCFINQSARINKLLKREGENSVTNYFIYWQTAVACGYSPNGEFLESSIKTPLRIYDFNDYIKYLNDISPFFLKEIFITTLNKQNWIVLMFLLHFSFFFLTTQKTIPLK